MINFTETDIKFIKSNIPNYEKIFKSSNLRDVLIVLSDWISKNGWDESGYNYSSLGRQAQAVYDNIKRTEKILEDYEMKLHMYSDYIVRSQIFDQILERYPEDTFLQKQVEILTSIDNRE